jgi:hypothetical protein
MDRDFAFHQRNLRSIFAVLSKTERFRIFLERLSAKTPAASTDGAVAMLSEILNAVEDEFSGIPCNPSLWMSDGRMYPPQEDNFRAIPKRLSLRRCRSKGHYIYFGQNGSIRIEALDGEILLDKPGADRRKAYDLDS